MSEQTTPETVATWGKPKLLDGIVLSEAGEEASAIAQGEEATSIMNPDTGQILIANEVGARMIELADGTRDIDAIADQVLQEFEGADKQTVVGHIRKFLAKATDKGIMGWSNRPA